MFPRGYAVSGILTHSKSSREAVDEPASDDRLPWSEEICDETHQNDREERKGVVTNQCRSSTHVQREKPAM